MMNDRQSLLTEDHGAIRIVTLNRPHKRNALSLELIQDLLDAVRGTADDSKVAALIIAAAGPVFSAGHDLTQLINRPQSDYAELFQTCADLMLTLQQIPQPVIAEVQGIATAAGCQLVAACDLAIAATTATFATPGVKIGLFCATPMIPLVRAIGRKRAMQMLLTGEPINAGTAADWGLINKVVEPSALRAETLALANRIATSSREVIATGKAAFYETIDLPDSAAYQQGSDVMTASAATRDAHEGISAFLEKRPPRWPGER